MKSRLFISLFILLLMATGCHKEEEIRVEQVRLDKEHVELMPQESVQLTATILPQNAKADILWTSSAPEVASVNNGSVQAVGPGECTITAKAQDKTATCAVLVRSRNAKIKLPDSYAMEAGQKTDLLNYATLDGISPSDLVWKSSEPDIVQVDQQGHIKALLPGESIISAEAGYDISYCTVRISDLRMNLSDQKLVLVSGQTKRIYASISTQGAEVEVIWSSSAPEIATVDSKGDITGIASGECSISASAAGTSVSCNVQVFSDEPISFIDKLVEKICLERWDTNKDGVLSRLEAAEAGDVDFSNTLIEHFPEFEFFTSVSVMTKVSFANCILLQDIKLPPQITKIPESCFSGCNKLESIQIPESVTIIDHYAFTGCSALTSIKLPETVEILCTKAFANCSSLKEINLPNSIYRIDDFCLMGTAITSLTIPTSFDTVPTGIAANCKQLKEVRLHDKIHTIGSYAFRGCSGLEEFPRGDQIQVLGDYAFTNCSGIKNLNLPSSLKTIGYSTFMGLTITRLTLPDSVVNIESYAFSQVPLETVQFSQSLQHIGSYAFHLCPIKNLSLPASVKNIGSYAFAGNKNPFEITFLSDNLGHLGAYAFAESGITAVHFAPGSTVKGIGDHAFFKCSDLKSVDWPQKLLFLGNYAFTDCTALESDIVLPDGLEELNFHVFQNCGKTKRLVIGKDVRTIKNNVAENSGFSGILTIPGNVRYLCGGAFIQTSLSGFIVEVPTQLNVDYASFWVEERVSRPIYVPTSYVDWCKKQWAKHGYADLVHDISELENNNVL